MTQKQATLAADKLIVPKRTSHIARPDNTSTTRFTSWEGHQHGWARARKESRHIPGLAADGYEKAQADPARKTLGKAVHTIKAPAAVKLIRRACRSEPRHASKLQYV